MSDLIREMIDDTEEDAEIFVNAKKFLQCQYAEEFTTIILDLSLPGIDGIELLELLFEKSKKWQLLLVSGHNDSVISAATLYAKNLGYQVIGALHKPFSRGELRGVLSRAV